MKPRTMDDLVALMAALRTPGSGCPWDIKQTFATIAPYTIEEAYEVADAIGRDDLDDLKDELGDLLLQVVFHARMAEEAGAFAFPDVAEAICDKLVRRHPHVFGADHATRDARSVQDSWEAIKAREKRARDAARGQSDAGRSVVDGVPAALPALARAVKLQAKAARVGFDWPDVTGVVDKIREELSEVEEALEGGDPAAVEAEIGDLLFAVANLARRAGGDAEALLRATNLKFERRFRFIEQRLAAAGRTPKEASLAEMEALWIAAKENERGAPVNASSSRRERDA